MKEIDIRQKTYHWLRELGYWPITQTDAAVCPKCHFLIRPPIGRPDILVLSPTGRSIVVECKFWGDTTVAFPKSSVSEEQIAWLDKWQAVGGRGYIALGVRIDRPARIYLFPWPAWKDLCAKTERKSLRLSDLEDYGYTRIEKGGTSPAAIWGIYEEKNGHCS